MSTKAQKIFAKFIRSIHPEERATFKSWLNDRGVKLSQVAYIDNGQRFTVHGNIPFHTKAKPAQAPVPKPKSKSKFGPYSSTRTQSSYDQSTQSSRPGFRNTKEASPKPPPRRRYSDDDYWDAFVKTSPDWTL